VNQPPASKWCGGVRWISEQIRRVLLTLRGFGLGRSVIQSQPLTGEPNEDVPTCKVTRDRGEFLRRSSPRPFLEVSGLVQRSGPLLAPVAHANWIMLLKIIGERAKNAQADRRGDKAQMRPVRMLDKVSLQKTADGPPRLADISSDPFEFFASFVCWQKGLMTS
jgi:hypothetical protein